MQSTSMDPKTLSFWLYRHVRCGNIVTTIAGCELDDLTLAHRSVSLDPSIEGDEPARGLGKIMGNRQLTEVEPS